MENKFSMGEFEEVVMLTVAILYEDAYGVRIKEELENRADRSVSVGALRTALKRLEKKGFLTSAFGEATAVRGGKRKRYFKVTPYGKQALDHVMDTRKALWEAIPSISFKFG
jgi:PadR family transcriptional regulator, regulatory protein PadR